MSGPAPQPPYQPPPLSEQHQGPWGAVLVALAALAVGGAAGWAISGNGNGDEQAKTVTRTTTATTAADKDVTVSVPTVTTTVEKTSA